MDDDPLGDDIGEDISEPAAEEAAGAVSAGAVCVSCGNPAIGVFCAWCGQKNDDLRRSSLVLARDFMRDTFGFDSRMWRTLGLLAVAPGLVPSNYASGRRSRYTPPVRLFLVVSFLFFLTLGLTNTLIIALDLSFDPAARQAVVIGDERSREEIEAEVSAALSEAARSIPDEYASDMESPKAEIDEPGLSLKTDEENCPTAASLKFFVRQSELAPVDRDLRSCLTIEAQEGASPEELQTMESLERFSAGAVRALENPVAFNNAFNNWLPRVMFLMTPILAFILAMFIRGRDALVFDHLVLALYTHAVGFALVILAVLASQAGVPHAGGAAAAAMFVYFFAALKRSYRRGWIKTAWTAIMASWLYMIILFTAVMLILWNIVWNG